MYFLASPMVHQFSVEIGNYFYTKLLRKIIFLSSLHLNVVNKIEIFRINLKCGLYRALNTSLVEYFRFFAVSC